MIAKDIHVGHAVGAYRAIAAFLKGFFGVMTPVEAIQCIAVLAHARATGGDAFAEQEAVARILIGGYDTSRYQDVWRTEAATFIRRYDEAVAAAYASEVHAAA